MERLQAGADTFVKVRTGQDRALAGDFLSSVNYEQNLLLATRVEDMDTITTTNSRACLGD